MSYPPDSSLHHVEALKGNILPITEGDPQPGYYRRRFAKDGPWVPVAFWRDVRSAALVCSLNGVKADPVEHWISAAKHAVTRDVWMKAVSDGVWPDEPEFGIGHNSGSEASELENLKEAVESTERYLRALKVETKTDADKAANTKTLLSKAIKAADEARRREKIPLEEQLKAIDERYQDWLRRGTAAAKACTQAYEGWLKAEEARRRKAAEEEAERRRKAAEAEAERLRREAEQHAAQLGMPAPEIPSVEVEPVKVEPVRIGGAVGARTSLRTEVQAIIEDYPAALAHFSEHEEVRELVQKLATRIIKAGGTVPGVRRHEERRAA